MIPWRDSPRRFHVASSCAARFVIRARLIAIPARVLAAGPDPHQPDGHAGRDADLWRRHAHQLEDHRAAVRRDGRHREPGDSAGLDHDRCFEPDHRQRLGLSRPCSVATAARRRASRPQAGQGGCAVLDSGGGGAHRGGGGRGTKDCPGTGCTFPQYYEEDSGDALASATTMLEQTTGCADNGDAPPPSRASVPALIVRGPVRRGRR